MKYITKIYVFSTRNGPSKNEASKIGIMLRCEYSNIFSNMHDTRSTRDLNVLLWAVRATASEHNFHSVRFQILYIFTAINIKLIFHFWLFLFFRIFCVYFVQSIVQEHSKHCFFDFFLPILANKRQTYFICDDKRVENETKYHSFLNKTKSQNITPFRKCVYTKRTNMVLNVITST